MKSIKTTFVRGLSLLLALVIMLNLPISAFASEAGQENDIAAAAADIVPSEMLTNDILSLLSIKIMPRKLCKTS